MKKKKLSLSIKGKTAVYIDAANIFYASKTLKYQIDFKKLIKYFGDNFNVDKIFYYTGFDPQNNKQIKFLDKLDKFGYRVIKKPIKKINKKGIYKEKANLDVELSIDAVINEGKYKNLVLVSGDSDFAYLLEILKRKGKKLIVISARGHISKELIINSDYYVPLESLKEKIARKKNHPAIKAGDVNLD